MLFMRCRASAPTLPAMILCLQAKILCQRQTRSNQTATRNSPPIPTRSASLSIFITFSHMLQCSGGMADALHALQGIRSDSAGGDMISANNDIMSINDDMSLDLGLDMSADIDMMTNNDQVHISHDVYRVFPYAGHAALTFSPRSRASAHMNLCQRQTRSNQTATRNSPPIPTRSASLSIFITFSHMLQCFSGMADAFHALQGIHSESVGDDTMPAADSSQTFTPEAGMRVAARAVHFDPIMSQVPLRKATGRWSYQHYGRMRHGVGWRTAEVYGVVMTVEDQVISVKWDTAVPATSANNNTPVEFGTTSIDLTTTSRGCEHQLKECFVEAPPSFGSNADVHESQDEPIIAAFQAGTHRSEDDGEGVQDHPQVLVINVPSIRGPPREGDAVHE
eukprot:SAG31_NODE_1720_length_7455_cov_3.242115_1_plen_393_part_00